MVQERKVTWVRIAELKKFRNYLKEVILYNKLEIRSRDNDVIKFIKENKRSFLDVIDSKGNIIIYNCKIAKYGQIEFLFKNTKISKINLENKKFYLYHVIY